MELEVAHSGHCWALSSLGACSTRFNGIVCQLGLSCAPRVAMGEALAWLYAGGQLVGNTAHALASAGMVCSIANPA
jgi:hypothetical protein